MVSLSFVKGACEMDVVITGRNLNVTEKLEDYVEKKVDRLERYMPDIGLVRVELSEANARNIEDRHVAQLTLHGEHGKILRAEESSADIMIAVDAAVDKLHRQIERYRGKRSRGKALRRRRIKSHQLKDSQLEAYQIEDNEGEAGVVRRKVFPVTPMDEEEAIEQLELLGHDFFLYYNVETAIVNVVYRRRGGGYGVLEPELS